MVHAVRSLACTQSQHRSGAAANMRTEKNRQLVGGGASSVPYDPPTACCVVSSLSLISVLPVSCIEGWSSCHTTDGKPTNLPNVTKSTETRKMSRNVTDVTQHRKIAFSMGYQPAAPEGPVNMPPPRTGILCKYPPYSNRDTRR